MFRNLADANTWLALRERSSKVISNAGPECLPLLVSQITHRDSSFAVSLAKVLGYLRVVGYALHLVDSAPVPGQDKGQVRRGQALTAILLVHKHGSSLVPELSAFVASNGDDPVTAAAAYALWEIAPEEFRQLRSPHGQLPDTARPPRAEPQDAAGGSQPSRSEAMPIPVAAGSRC